MRVIEIVRATTWGGGERYALDLTRALVEHGHDVTVATRGIPAIDAVFSDTGAEMVEMPLGGVLDLTSPRRLARLVEGMPEDCVTVHVHNFKDAEIVARAKRLLRSGKRIRLVCTRHLVKPGKTGRRWRFIYDAIDRLIFVSALAKDEFLRSLPPVDEERLSVIHNSVRVPDEYSVAEVPASAPGEPLRLLFTGRVAPEKGIDILIRALPHLSPLSLRLRITGTGDRDYIDSLKSLAREEGVEDMVEWAGFREDVFAEIREADVCVFPSVWREPFGLTIIEAMSQARPVVTTDNGAQREIITDGVDGLLVEAGSPEALATAIRRLAGDPALRRSMGEEAADTFRSRFSYDLFYDKMIEALGIRR